LLGRAATSWRMAAFALDPVGALRHFEPLGQAVELARLSKHSHRTLVIWGPDYNRRFLMSTKAMTTSGLWSLRSPPSSAQAALRSNHPLKTHGSEHAAFSALIDPYFNRAAIGRRFGEIRSQLVEEIRAWRPGVSDFYRLARRLTERVAFSLLFGEEARDRFAEFGDLLHEHHRNNWRYVAHMLPVNLAGTPYGDALRSAEALRDFIDGWRTEPGSDDPTRSLFGGLATSLRADGCPYSAAGVNGAVAMVSWLSYETMATALNWAVFLLAQHPAIQADLADELAQLGAVEDLDADDLMSAPVLDAVVKESMRLITPVPLLSFRAVGDGDIAGHWYFHGTRIYVAAHLTHRLPDLYPAPDRFRPARWFGLRPTAYEYLPFGAGQRRCPGAWLANTNLKLALAALLSRFRPTPVAGARVDHRYAVVTMPWRGMPIDLAPREAAARRLGDARSGSIFRLFTPEPDRGVRA